MDAHEDISNRSVTLKVLSPPTLSEAVLVALAGKRLLVTAVRPVPPGALLQTKVSGATVLGEVIACTPNGGSYEIWVEISHSLSVDWRPHPTWTGTPESVLDSLCTLNGRLSDVSTSSARPSNCELANPGAGFIGIDHSARPYPGHAKGNSNCRGHVGEDFALAKLAQAVSKTSRRLQKIISGTFAS